jgi:transcriptional regulator with XRE-family HTH domain
MMQGLLAHKLRVLRAERGLTLREAAAKSGVAKETISDIERGLRHPHDPTLAKIAKGYGVPVEELLEEPALAAGKGEASQEAGSAEAKWQRPSLDQVRDTFAPLADGLNRYCARWEEVLPNLQGPSEEVADFFLDLQDFIAIILRVFEDELDAIAEALDLRSRYGGGKSGLPRDTALGFMRAEVEEHSLMREALMRYSAVGQALAESTGNEEMAESMRQALAGGRLGNG